MQDTMKNPNLQVICIDEGEESQVNNTDQTLKNHRRKLCQTKKEHTHTDTRSTHKIKQIRQDRNSSQHIQVETLNTQNKESILKTAKEKTQITYKEKSIRVTVGF